MEILLTVLFVLLTSAQGYAAAITFQVSGTADSGEWNGNSLAGRAYQLRVSTDTDIPDSNFFSDFGQWFRLPGFITLEGLGVVALGQFAFIEQFRVTNATFDRLRFRGPDSGPDSDLFLPLGTLGDPDFLSVWGPVQTIGDGQSSMAIRTPDGLFTLHDQETATDRITALTFVPEPPTLAVIGMSAVIFASLALQRRR
jgi:hypothetical protein